MATYPVISVSVGRAKPKSKIFNSQSSFTAMFEGFKSYLNEKIGISKQHNFLLIHYQQTISSGN